MNTAELLNLLIYSHLQEFSSGRELLQALQEDAYARNLIAASILPAQHIDFGDLVAIDGSLIDSVLSMHWTEYYTNSRKAKLHLGFNLNHGIPGTLVLTEGKDAERPFVSQIIEPGQTAVLDRGYQAHHLFDQWQSEGRHFVCRIKDATRKEVLEAYLLAANFHVFFDAKVVLGTPNISQMDIPDGQLSQPLKTTTTNSCWLYQAMQ